MSTFTDTMIDRLGTALAGGAAISPISAIALGGYANWRSTAYWGSNYTSATLNKSSTALVHEFETKAEMENMQRRSITPSKTGNVFTIEQQAYQTQVHTESDHSELVDVKIKELGIFSSDNALLFCFDNMLTAKISTSYNWYISPNYIAAVQKDNVGGPAEQNTIYSVIVVNFSLTVRRLA